MDHRTRTARIAKDAKLDQLTSVKNVGQVTSKLLQVTFLQKKVIWFDVRRLTRVNNHKTLLLERINTQVP